MVLPLWRSLHSLNLMLPKEDRKAMLLRLFNEDTPLMDHSKDRFTNNSKPQPNVNIKDEPNDIKNEEEPNADVKDEMAVKEEDEEGNVAVPEFGEDVERMEDGAGNEERQDDVLPNSFKEEVDYGV